MNLSTLPEVFEAFKRLLEPLGCEIYDHVPENPNVPCIIIVPERIPYDITQGMTVVLWCLTGMVETKGAQQDLLAWLDDSSGSIVALIDADNQLGGVVSSVCPLEVRTWGVAPFGDGRPRYWQAELVCDVLP